MNRVRLYGRTLGHSSLAVVTAGFRGVLDRAGLLAGVYGVDLPDNEDTAGAAAYHGVYTGSLGALEEMFKHGRHMHYWIMLAPNSNRLPKDLVRLLHGFQDRYGTGRVHFMAPSAWGATVVQQSLDHCRVVPHGIDPTIFHVDEVLASASVRHFLAGEFRVAHFSTSDRQRKGTLELIQAWRELALLWDWQTSKLLCVMDYPAKAALLEALAEAELPLPDSVVLADRQDTLLSKIYSTCHLVCQPSRGEGFGLVPLEALACGVPVAMTCVTGHTEYMDPNPISSGVEIIETGELTPIDDLPGSQAPSLASRHIAQALLRARGHWLTHQADAIRCAPVLHEEWSWAASLAGFVELLEA